MNKVYIFLSFFLLQVRKRFFFPGGKNGKKEYGIFRYKMSILYYSEPAKNKLLIQIQEIRVHLDI